MGTVEGVLGLELYRSGLVLFDEAVGEETTVLLYIDGMLAASWREVGRIFHGALEELGQADAAISVAASEECAPT